MTTSFRPGVLLRIGNAFMTTLVRLGVKVGPNLLLTVRGRKSGVPRTTPVAVIEHEGKRYLIAAYGVVDWVRNLQAAGEATLTHGQKVEQVIATQLPPQEAGVVLKRQLARAPSFVRSQFNLNSASTLADYERESLTHPVFLIQTATSTKAA